MNIEEIHSYCLNKPCTEESFPFDDTALVFKVCNKMYALVIIEGDLRLNLKCNPEWAIELREAHKSIIPGYHMNKKHWNTIEIDGSVPTELVKKMIDHSYDLVVNSLPKNLKAGLIDKK